MPSALLAARKQRRPTQSLFALLRQALALRRSRARLGRLDDHLLRDIGLTRDDALAEAQRPLWDAPRLWRG